MVFAVVKPGDNSQRLFKVGPERVRADRGQVPPDRDGFLDGGQRRLPSAQVGQQDRQVGQRGGQVGPERVCFTDGCTASR